MQRPDKQGKDYGDIKEWSTVKRKNNRKYVNKPRPDYRKEHGTSYNLREPTISSKQSYKGNVIPSNRFSRRPVDRFSRFNKKYGGPPKVTYVPPIKTGPNYASIIKEKESKSTNDNEVVNVCKIEYIKNIPNISIFRNKQIVRNQTPKPNNHISFSTWEHKYFKHIVDLSDIFSEGANKLDIDTDSLEFLSIFSSFIRECSSGEISPYIEDFNSETEELYMEYAIKRNDF
jgi:hypothetical protein